MLIRIDPLAPEPIFEQIAFQVKGAVARGELRAGDRLPSVRELAKQATVNPNTVVKAYEVLHQDGIIVRRQGSGCFVTGQESKLHDTERERQLTALVEKTVTEAYHLGFTASEIKKALDEGLRRLHFARKKKSSS